MTRLEKPVRRASDLATIRDAGKVRALIVTLYPNGTIGLRPEGTRQKREELITMGAAYSLGVRQRVAKEQAEKKARKKNVR